MARRKIILKTKRKGPATTLSATFPWHAADRREHADGFAKDLAEWQAASVQGCLVVAEQHGRCLREMEEAREGVT